MKKQFAMVLLAIVFMGASVWAYGTTVTVNDNTVGTGTNQFNYQGSSWSYNSQSGAYDSDNHWAYTTNDYYTFQFNGQQAAVYGSLAPNGGIAAYSVDGGAETNFDDYAATRSDNVFLFSTPILSSGIHTLKVRVTGLKNSASTSYILPADRIDVNSGLTAVTVNDNTVGTGNSQFNYQGSGWFYGSASDAYDNDNHWDYTINDYYTFQFNGQQAIVYGSMDTNAGIAAYSVDGGAESNFDDYAATRVDNVYLFATPILSSGTHTLKVRVTGLENPASSYYVLGADRIDISTVSSGGTVATPTFSPGAGTYTSAQTVTISDSTSGATIHYTTDGSTPTTSSTVYSSPINVSISETVKAIGVETGWTDSAVGSAAYTITSLTVATPTFSPGAGTYSSAQTVTISDATSGATIYYTTDGSTPTTSSTIYFGPISVSTSETVKAIGVLSGYTNSAVGSAAYTISSGSGQTWYIRHDGGDNVQCTGTTNAAYPGSGTGMPCAYNHPFQMMNWSGGWTSFASGDTMQFADSPTNTTPYYMGEQNAGVGTDWNPTLGGVCPPPNSAYPAGASCILPIPPNGTTIKGQNYGNCHTAGHTGLVNPTILSGIDGEFAVLYVQGTSNVTISCIEVTQPDNCTTAGTGPGQCGGTSNYVHYAGLMLEYETGQGPANMTLTDFAAVGIAGRGIMGSHLNLLSTDTFTASDIYVIGNGQAGWDGDGGGCNNSCESVGTMNVSYADIEWNGCLALKPYNIGVSPETAPNSFNYCYEENTGGYGDGFTQLAAGNLTLNMSHSKFKYNTQDGFDALHLSDDSTTSPATTITDSWSEGNAGQNFKIGAGASSTAINNVSISNCRVLSQAATFPNNPSGWVTLDGGDTCRGEEAWALALRNGTSITLENNTSVGYATTGYDLSCSYFAPSCGSNGGQVVFTNNITKGYPDPGNDGQLGGGFYLESGLSGANVTADHNLWNTVDPSNTGCPDNTLLGETNYLCSDPLLTGESNIDAINPTPTSTSPVIGAGIHIPGITTDYYGTTRPNPPSIGAIE